MVKSVKLFTQLIIVLGLLNIPTFAQNTNKGASGLPLPRFVSIKASRVNMRVGPGRDYSVSWLYVRKGLPLEIIQEFDNWRRVRDSEGESGWIHRSLLSGKRTAITAPWLKNKDSARMLFLKKKPKISSQIIAKMEAGVILNVLNCDSEWCEVEIPSNDAKGYVAQEEVWGAYPGEAFR